VRDRVLRILQEVAAGAAAPGEALERLAWLPVEAVGEDGSEAFARLDHHRALRQGQPEVVFGPGKTADQLLVICRRLEQRGDGVLVTRIDAPIREVLGHEFPGGAVDDTARTFFLAAAERPDPDVRGSVLVVTAGTGDLPVAEEAAVTASAFGNPVERLYDVGVAGIHRVLDHRETLARAAVVIVVAGMEGALPSVVGGLVAVPVIAVPTSVGYGTAFGGVTPLLGMLNSCAAGVTVVNIDNGFGAAIAATRINQVATRTTAPTEP
jgi:NCAIR mutase (PurE)-related protein